MQFSKPSLYLYAYIYCSTMALYQLIYRSKARIRPSDVALSALLQQCREKNTPKNITGILLYGYGMFIQLLEGDDELVRELYYEHIANDPRHYDMKVLQEGFVPKRLFQDWSMAFRTHEPQRYLSQPGFVDPDTPSVYGRRLLSPLMTMEAMEMLSAEVHGKKT